MGLGTFCHRPAAQLCRVGNRCADHADLPAPVPRAGARRRVRRAAIYVAEHAPKNKRGFYTSWIQTTATVACSWRCSSCSAFAPGWARPNSRPRIAHRRLAHSIPALGDPARGVDLDQVEAQRIAGLPADEGRGPRLEAPADRGVRPMGQPEDRNPRLAGRNRRRSRGLVRRPVLRAVLPDPERSRSRR
jgi:hypothetical protein